MKKSKKNSMIEYFKSTIKEIKIRFSSKYVFITDDIDNTYY